MNRLLLEARKIHKKAIQEFERGDLWGDKFIIRDSAEKAWLSAVMAIDALITSKGEEIPFGAGAHEFRNKTLSDWAEENPEEIKEIYDYFALIRDTLHGNCFYYGNCPRKLTEEKIKIFVKQFLDKVEAMLNGGS
ncbi:MAG TPA: hypothetical protein EYP22_05590 [Methanosarcinales archaeon]|nr:hypothetical protein [Methanosarcinales archaeon]